MSNSAGEKRKKEIIDRVAGDPRRVPYEKETIFRFNREEKEIYVNSFDPTIIKAFLNHKFFDMEGFTEGENDRVVGVSGKLPRGVIKVKKEPRKRDYPSTIVSSEGKEK